LPRCRPEFVVGRHHLYVRRHHTSRIFTDALPSRLALGLPGLAYGPSRDPSPLHRLLGASHRASATRSTSTGRRQRQRRSRSLMTVELPPEGQVRTGLTAGGRRIRTLGPSPKDPLLVGEPKKASSGSSTPRMRLGPQGDRGAEPAPFYESAEPNIPAASHRGMACRDPRLVARDRWFESTSLQRRIRGELRNRLHSGDRQLSGVPLQQRLRWSGTESSNPSSSSRESATNQAIVPLVCRARRRGPGVACDNLHQEP
jgi:hypothetical protein